MFHQQVKIKPESEISSHTTLKECNNQFIPLDTSLKSSCQVKP